MEEQAVTLQTYRSGVETYAALTPDTVDGSMKIWLDAGFEGLPGSCSVFELGSATGRDAVSPHWHRTTQQIALGAAKSFVDDFFWSRWRFEISVFDLVSIGRG